MAEDPPSLLDLSVVIVNYNVREFLEQALRSVERASAGLDIEVFVVDNNSVDGSVEMVQERFPAVRLIANPENVGFGRANNQALREARGRYLLILNPDTIVQEDTFHTLLRFMEAHPDAGAVGCQILNPDGTFAPESRRAFPTPQVAFFRMTGLGRLFPRSRTFGRYNLTYLPRDQVAEVDALSGSCMLVRRAAVYSSFDEYTKGERGRERGDLLPSQTGAGLFDEDFFMYGEDLDWCFRIQQAGWKIYYTPETQIIHYKGESTKRGELRYVRHFYGAMLLFTQKHFQDRYSRVLAGLLRLAILTRAVLTVLSGALRRLKAPLLDFLTVYAVVTVIGFARSALAGADLNPLFFATVAPGFALGTIAGLLLAGGYRAPARRRLRPVWIGAGVGLLFTAAASFFVKEIAFSRVAVLLSFPVTGVLLSAVRLLRPAGQAGVRRALLVGYGAEAQRLQRMLAGHPRPPFDLIGYVEPTPPRPSSTATVPRIGTLHQLRDLVRLRRIDDVVFAGEGLSNRTIFQLMQRLRDLPVQFRMLAEGQAHVIGKTSIDDLSAPSLLDVARALGTPRSRAARRAFEIPIALFGLLLHLPVSLLARRGAAGSVFAHLAARTRRMPDVLSGRCALIGFAPHAAFQPPEEWDLRPGVFTITDTLGTPNPSDEEAGRAYWFYVCHQSASLDWDILVRTLSKLKREP